MFDPVVIALLIPDNVTSFINDTTLLDIVPSFIDDPQIQSDICSFRFASASNGNANGAVDGNGRRLTSFRSNVPTSSKFSFFQYFSSPVAFRSDVTQT